MARKLDKAFASFPETDLRFVLNGTPSANQGISGMLLKPWDERKRTAMQLKPLVQAKLSQIPGVNAFAFNLPALPGGPGGLPIQMVINSTARLPGDLQGNGEDQGGGDEERALYRQR